MAPNVGLALAPRRAQPRRHSPPSAPAPPRNRPRSVPPGGFLKDQVVPHLESGTERLEQMAGAIDALADPDQRKHAAARLNTLHTWQKRTQKLIPLALTVLGGAKQLAADSGDDARTVV